MTPEQRARKMLFGDPEWGTAYDIFDDHFIHPESAERITIRELAARYATEDAEQ